jgi:hypothetical protein
MAEYAADSGKDAYFDRLLLIMEQGMGLLIAVLVRVTTLASQDLRVESKASSCNSSWRHIRENVGDRRKGVARA